MKSMEQRTKEAVAYRKISDCIASCINQDQLISCVTMIQNFKRRFERDSKEDYYTRTSDRLNRLVFYKNHELKNETASGN